MFGKPATTNGTTQPSTFGGSTFGSTFGSTNQTPSMFGVNATNNTIQGTLTLTIDKSLNTNIPTSSLLSSGPQPNSLDAPIGKKRAEFFVGVPTRSSIVSLWSLEELRP